MSAANPKIRAASISILAAVSLATIKLVVALASGSMAVLASAVDSLLDILMSGVNFVAIRHAEQPADKCHPFGHGKFETMATLFQALIITASGSLIIFESTRRLLNGIVLQKLDQGVSILAFSALVSWLVARYLKRVARSTDSSALEADSLHFSMDIYTNLALLTGLLLIRWLDIPWLDPTLSIFVGIYILYEALRLVRHSMRDVLDQELPAEMLQEIRALIEKHQSNLGSYHDLRTRRAGSRKIMDFHLEVCKHMSVEDAHKIADQLEKQIEKSIIGADVTIHIEPCTEAECPGANLCEQDKSRFKGSEDKRKT
ncbi:MAG TPA: cation diffusion facilitator family transporter [Geopsychrobacteraceae bacterium]|nr:cation diffusion facilitator family transporter [Geopsychrobacteraceae bacterium]